MPRVPTEDAIRDRDMLNASLAGCTLTSIHLSAEGFYFHFRTPSGKESDLLCTAKEVTLWDAELGGPFLLHYAELPEA